MTETVSDDIVAWRIVGDDGVYLVYREEKDARDALGRIHSRTLRLDSIEPLVPASIVDDLRADLTRYIDIANAEATEAESLRAERDALAKALRLMQCPRPCNHRPDEFDVGDCINAGECGCVAGSTRQGDAK